MKIARHIYMYTFTWLYLTATLILLSLLHRRTRTAILEARKLPEEYLKLPVSILIPCFQMHARKLQNISLWLEQNYSGPMEIILSTQSELDYQFIKRSNLYKDPRVKVLYRPTLDAWQAKSSNLQHAYVHARFPYLILTDDDTQASRNSIYKIVEILKNQPKAIVGAMVSHYGGETFFAKLFNFSINRALYLFMLPELHSKSKNAHLCGACIAIRKSNLEQLNGFQEISGYLADDFRLAQLAQDQGLEFCLGPEVFVENTCMYQKAFISKLHRYALTANQQMPYGKLIFGILQVTQNLYWLPFFYSIYSFSFNLFLLSLVTMSFKATFAGHIHRYATGQYDFAWSVILTDLLGFWAYIKALKTPHVRFGSQRLLVGKKGKIDISA